MSHGLERFPHIAIEGPIGAGKTTLALQLANRLGAEALLERPADNPFLDRFYADMAGYAFQTQLFFLFQRQKQMHAIAQPNMFSAQVVSDFMFAKDRVFARLTLSDEEFRLYAQMYSPIAAELREPDLVVWLQAPAATLLGRVRSRGIAMEQGIDLDYLERLCEGYAAFFSSYSGAPVFAVDTTQFNPLARPDEVVRLVAQLASFRQRRGLFDSGGVAFG
jgi:deoxyguanosine kinase